MKTSNEILTDIFKLIKSTPIDNLVGGIYKKVRPTDSELEDCVISLVSGTNAKFLQDAALYVKLFFLDENQDDTYYENNIRGSFLEYLMWDLSIALLNLNGYSFDVMSREIYIEAVEDIHQRYVILKINFQITID